MVLVGVFRAVSVRHWLGQESAEGSTRLSAHDGSPTWLAGDAAVAKSTAGHLTEVPTSGLSMSLGLLTAWQLGGSIWRPRVLRPKQKLPPFS